MSRGGACFPRMRRALSGRQPPTARGREAGRGGGREGRLRPWGALSRQAAGGKVSQWRCVCQLARGAPHGAIDRYTAVEGFRWFREICPRLMLAARGAGGPPVPAGERQSAGRLRALPLAGCSSTWTRPHGSRLRSQSPRPPWPSTAGEGTRRTHPPLPHGVVGRCDDPGRTDAPERAPAALLTEYEPPAAHLTTEYDECLAADCRGDFCAYREPPLLVCNRAARLHGGCAPSPAHPTTASSGSARRAVDAAVGQCPPDLRQVGRIAQAGSGDLLEAPEPVAQRVGMDVQGARSGLQTHALP